MRAGSLIGRLWVDCLIQPVLIPHLFVHAERQADWLLHLYCLRRMLPYFFVANHNNYAKYITWHLLEVSAGLPEDAQNIFLTGEHVCRHKNGTWNAVFSDQFGKQTYIRYGKAKGGLVGLTLSSEQVARCVLFHYTCNLVSSKMDKMYLNVAGQAREFSKQGTVQKSTHKETGKNRKKLGAQDRMKISEKLRLYTNPMEACSEHKLFNIINGKIVSEKTNVHNALQIGEAMLSKFKAKLPSGFHQSIRKEVITMENTKKSMKLGDTAVYDPERLYARMLIVSQKRDLNLKDVFSHELCPVPSALFDDYGDMRKSSKAALVSKVAKFCEKPPLSETEIVDGNELLYHINWPKLGTVDDLANRVIKNFSGKGHTIYVVFDRYRELSVKAYDLQRNAILPAKEDIMKSSRNKQQLIKHISETKVHGKLHLIGDKQCKFDHEEADVNIIAYMLEQINKGIKHIQITADDTDIFVLAVYFLHKYNLKANIVMKKNNGRFIDINSSAESLGTKCLDLLALNAVSGCDSVSFPYGKGKVTSVNVLMQRERIFFNAIGDIDSNRNDIFQTGKTFFAKLYGGKQMKITSMNELRFQLFTSRKAKAPAI